MSAPSSFPYQNEDLYTKLDEWTLLKKERSVENLRFDLQELDIFFGFFFMLREVSKKD